MSKIVTDPEDDAFVAYDRAASTALGARHGASDRPLWSEPDARVVPHEHDDAYEDAWHAARKARKENKKN